MILIKIPKDNFPTLEKNCFQVLQIFNFCAMSSGNAFASGAGGLRFKFRAVQIGHTAAVAVRFRKKLCCWGVMMRRWAPQTRYALRRDTASVAKVSQRKKIFKSASYASIRPMVGKRRIKFVNT